MTQEMIINDSTYRPEFLSVFDGIGDTIQVKDFFCFNFNNLGFFSLKTNSTDNALNQLHKEIKQTKKSVFEYVAEPE